jgi:hypothetical protein
VLLATACGTTPSPSPASSPSVAPSLASTPSTPSSPAASPTPAPSVDSAAVYTQIEGEVESIRGLRAKAPVARKVLDPAGMTKVVTDELEEGTDPVAQKATERALKALGLLPADASLQQLYLELLTSQVAGLYDPATKTMYVLSKAGAPGPVERVTFAHEFDHALQDQNFGHENLNVDQVGEGDRDLAHLSVAEGDATLLMSLWAGQHLTPAETLELLAASSDPKQLETLRTMPSILRETLLFPYQTGLAFISGLQASGGWDAVNGAFTRPPDSTEQLLHPEKYASREAVLPVDVPEDLAARLGTGWTLPLTDSLGEFQTRIWLRDVGKLAEINATNAAAGWGGDRLLVAEGPDGAWAVALVTRWDTPNDASAFEGAARTTVATLAGGGRVAEVRTSADGLVLVLIGENVQMVGRLASALGVAA